MIARARLFGVGVGTLLSGTLLGHTILLRGVRDGIDDEFLHAESEAHAQGLASFVGLKGAIAIGIGLAALMLYTRYHRRIPAFALGAVPVVSLLIQEGLERGVGGLPSLIQSASVLVLVAVSAVLGGVLVRFAGRLFAAVVKAVRRLGWTADSVVACDARRHGGYERRPELVPKRQRLLADGTAPRGPPLRRLPVSLPAR